MRFFLLHPCLKLLKKAYVNILKYTLNSNKAAQQTESKPNMVETGEVNQQTRRVYKNVANNFRFKKKYKVGILSDKIDRSK